MSDRRRRALLAAALLLPAASAFAQTPAASADASLDELLRLIERRLALADAVARSKWNSGAPVEDLPRERAIVETIGREAPRYGLAPAFAMDFFRAQIDASKIAQNALLAQWRAAARAPFADAPDLQRDVRPQLDTLTPLLLAALARALPTLRESAARGQLERFAAGGTARAAAVAPLSRSAP